MKSHCSSTAFTLIELLVVISIIVVLLALLTPALDRVIHRAEMLNCATTQKAAMNCVMVYAADFARQYPYRPWTAYGGSSPFGQLNAGGSGPDDRAPMRDYVPINKVLTCPLSPYIDIEGSKPETVVWAQYELWFGFNYIGLPGMRKIGDRIVAQESISGQERRYDLLISDVTQVRWPAPDWGMAGHRDSLDFWSPEVFQDAPFTNAGKTSATIGWYTGTFARGTLDLNFGYQDGSARRVDGIAYKAEDNEGIDQIPNYRNPATDSLRFIQVPSGP